MSCDKRCFDPESKWHGHEDCETCPGADKGPAPKDTMEEFQARFEHPPCGICGDPMVRSCFCADLKTWEDSGGWHCQSYGHSYYQRDPELYEAASKRLAEVLNR